jgi:hypothetical protein
MRKRQMQNGRNPTLQMARIVSPLRSEVNEKNRIPTRWIASRENNWGKRDTGFGRPNLRALDVPVETRWPLHSLADRT